MRRAGMCLVVFGGWLAIASSAYAQTVSPARALITSPVDESRRVTLVDNTRPEATPENDRGRVPDSFPLNHMQLLLRAPADREAAIERYASELTDRSSPHYHDWMSAAEAGYRFGPAPADIAAVTGWLRAVGFQVNTVYPSGRVIDFSGSASLVAKAFRTEIHFLLVDGVSHFANMSDPEIPEALAPAIVGIVSLHDFRPRPMFVPSPEYTAAGCGGRTCYSVAPADLATIYDFKPVYAAGITGRGQVIALIESSNVNSIEDWRRFRSEFGLTIAFQGATLMQMHPQAPSSSSSNCIDPGNNNGATGEATLDTEWASASAPGARLVIASCADTQSSTSGILIALENIIAGSNGDPPPIISISYGECEQEMGSAFRAAVTDAVRLAALAGSSVFFAAGDSSAAACDRGQPAATHGITVSGFATTSYAVAVGGTDFGDTFMGKVTDYWSATNGAKFGSALSYIPEIPWNDSCAGEILSTFHGASTAFGADGFCNTTADSSYFTTTGGGGGPSCCNLNKPSWQSGVAGIANDGRRDIPDVALFASEGFWHHAYIFCDSALASCGASPTTWSHGGGTSFASPIWAGIQALENQAAGTSRQGNAAPVLYQLAQQAYGTNGNPACASKTSSSSCIFHDVVLGDNDVDCRGTIDCFRPSGARGVLSTSDMAYKPSFHSATGWDFTSGLGTPDVAKLIAAWTKQEK